MAWYGRDYEGREDWNRGTYRSWRGPDRGFGHEAHPREGRYGYGASGRGRYGREYGGRGSGGMEHDEGFGTWRGEPGRHAYGQARGPAYGQGRGHPYDEDMGDQLREGWRDLKRGVRRAFGMDYDQDYGASGRWERWDRSRDTPRGRGGTGWERDERSSGGWSGRNPNPRDQGDRYW